MNDKKPKNYIIKLLLVIGSALALFMIANIKVSSKQGINYSVGTIKMPLYIKIIEFIDRDYHYKEIVKKVTQDCFSEEEKVLALFNWSCSNIRKIPVDFPVFDDHILNIIIRGYGADDQAADVFNILCVYSGLPAMRTRLYPKDSKAHINVSVVKINGKLSIFDVYRHHYFINDEGKVASLEEIINTPSLLAQQTNGKIYEGIEYARFFENLSSIREIETIRSREQIPISRMICEFKKMFKINK